MQYVRANRKPNYCGVFWGDANGYLDFPRSSPDVRPSRTSRHSHALRLAGTRSFAFARERLLLAERGSSSVAKAARTVDFRSRPNAVNHPPEFLWRLPEPTRPSGVATLHRFGVSKLANLRR